MASRKKTARKSADNGNDNDAPETEAASDAQLVTHNVTKEHFMIFPLDNGLVGVVPVQALSVEHVDANYTAVDQS